MSFGSIAVRHKSQPSKVCHHCGGKPLPGYTNNMTMAQIVSHAEGHGFEVKVSKNKVGKIESIHLKCCTDFGKPTKSN